MPLHRQNLLADNVIGSSGMVQSTRQANVMNANLDENAESLPQVTVVITCRERYQLTETMIDELVRNTRIPIRLLYVDTGDPDWLRSKIAERSREWRLEVIRFDEPLWPTQARSRIVDLIDTKYAVFIDNDVLVHSGWLEHLYECAEQTGAGIVGPLYLWGADAQADSIHMAGGELVLERGDNGDNDFALIEKHRCSGKKLDQVALRREECDFAEFHCMLMRQEVFRAPSVFDGTIVCAHEHIHASLAARELGYKTFFEPAARVNYLAFFPYSLADLSVFRWRWSLDAGESSIRAFANRWGVIDDERSFGGVRSFLELHRAQVDPVRATLQDPRTSQTPMQESDLKQIFTGLMELAFRKGYNARDLERIEATYWRALWLSNGGYRPCGRPFINHLVGTASVLVHYGFEVRLVQAALMHSAYTHAPHFDGGAEKTVEVVARKLGGLGSNLEQAVRAYTVRSMRWQQLSVLPNWEAIATMSDVDTAILTLANDTDMNLSGEVRATERTDVGNNVALSKVSEICQILGVPGMAGGARPQPPSGPAVRIPRKIRPKGSVRIEGTAFVSMFNRSFSQIQNSNPVAGSQWDRFLASVRSFVKNWD
jgi:GT2 family glycosyltransferase